MERGRLLTLPNAVSMSRLVFAAGFLSVRDPYARLALIATASATDFLDGWLARRANGVSRWGAIIDPIADRAFVFAAVCAFLIEGALSLGQCLLLMARDIATAIGFVVARTVPWLRPVALQARMLGKLVTVLQLMTLFAILLAPAHVPWLVVIVGVLSVGAIADYTLMLWRERAK